MFNESTYSVDEGGTVDVVVTLCGAIMDDVVATLTTNDDSAGIVQPFHNVHFRPVGIHFMMNHYEHSVVDYIKSSTPLSPHSGW